MPTELPRVGDVVWTIDGSIENLDHYDISPHTPIDVVVTEVEPDMIRANCFNRETMEPDHDTNASYLLEPDEVYRIEADAWRAYASAATRHATGLAAQAAQWFEKARDAGEKARELEADVDEPTELPR